MLSFVLVSSLDKYYLIFPIMLIANVLNVVWGEFTEREILKSMKDFYSDKVVVLFKRFSAVLLTGFIVWSVVFFDSSPILNYHSVLFTFAVGCLCGCFIVTLAHDLLHSHHFIDRILSNVLLLVSCCPHLAGDHIHGHHNQIGLREDVSTAKKNQNVYHFIIENIKDRLRNSFTNKLNLSEREFKAVRRLNFFLFTCLFLIVLLIYVFAQQKIYTVLFFLGQGFVAYTLYEIINYIQHYGLKRSNKNIPISQFLSWNCYYKYTNYILFMLPIHSLHHLPDDQRKTVREELKAGPKMPYLYFVMVGMSLIPPLWFSKMNNLAD